MITYRVLWQSKSRSLCSFLVRVSENKFVVGDYLCPTGCLRADYWRSGSSIHGRAMGGCLLKKSSLEDKCLCSLVSEKPSLESVEINSFLARKRHPDCKYASRFPPYRACSQSSGNFALASQFGAPIPPLFSPHFGRNEAQGSSSVCR